MDTKKSLNYYLGLNWSYTIEQESHEGEKFYIISVNELPGVRTDATSIEEGMREIKDSIVASLELYLEQGDPIPEPLKKEKYRGNIAYRTTQERHYSLAKLAKNKHISMNKALDMVFDAGIQKLQILSNR